MLQCGVASCWMVRPPAVASTNLDLQICMRAGGPAGVVAVARAPNLLPMRSSHKS